MQDGEHGKPIDDAVQPVPADRPETADHRVRRGHAQHGKADERNEADGEIEAQDDLARDLGEVVGLVDHIETEMQHRIGERRDADHAADEDQPRPVEDMAGGRDGERQQQQPDGPVAGLVDRFGDRLGAEQTTGRLDGKPEARGDDAGEGDELQPGQSAGPVVPWQHAADLLQGAVDVTPYARRRQAVTLVS